MELKEQFILVQNFSEIHAYFFIECIFQVSFEDILYYNKIIGYVVIFIVWIF